jgi:hypothetical protein
MARALSDDTPATSAKKRWRAEVGTIGKGRSMLTNRRSTKGTPRDTKRGLIRAGDLYSIYPFKHKVVISFIVWQ